MTRETSDWSDTASTSSHDVQRLKSENKKQMISHGNHTTENHIFHENRSHSNKVNKALLISAIKFFPIFYGN